MPDAHRPSPSAGTPTEGEVWARDELGALLDARFTPGAIATFLARSQRRANDRRRERPATAARARTWGAAGAALWLTLAAAGVQPFRRRTREGLAWWGGCVLMLDWHLGMVETEDGRPRNLGGADAATLLRAWLVPVAADTPSPVVCLAAFV